MITVENKSLIEPSAKILNVAIEETNNKILQDDYWTGSVFETIAIRGRSDHSGKWGERICNDFINTLTDIAINWDGDKNTKQPDGTYDIWYITPGGVKIRIEVKTSFLNGFMDTKGNPKKPKWQHENIIEKKNQWDKLILVDVEYDVIWFTIIDYSDMIFNDKHPVFGVTPCLRTKRVDGYKWDFQQLQIERGEAAGYTFCYDISDPDDDALAEFFNTRLSV